MGIDAEMLVKTRQSYTPAQVRRLSVDLCEAFGADNFLIVQPGQWDDMPEGRHALELVDVYTQDGPDILPELGEQFVRVHLFSRYYGIGYERGPISEHIAIAQWLEVRIPDAHIFYGGDSSGVYAEPFGRKERDAIFAHFASVGNRPYSGGFGAVFAKDHAPLCGFCDYAMTNYGGGKDREFYGCDGCGKRIIRLASGDILNVKVGQSYSDVE